MSTASITIHVDHGRIAAAEDEEQLPGIAIAEALRAMAASIESDIAVIPYPGGEWVNESYTYVDSEGATLGTLSLEVS